MKFINIISGWLEFKKQTLIIVALSLIVAALGGLYIMNNGGGENATKPDVDVKVTIEQPKPNPDNSDAFRKGTFKKSKPVSW